MRVFAHPLRLDGAGAIATVEQWSTDQAAQVSVAICSTTIGERTLAPQFGITDPVGVGVNPDEVAAAIDLCEPDLELIDVDVQGRETQTVTLTVAWSEDEDEAI